jgi:hypothetical protein
VANTDLNKPLCPRCNIRNSGNYVGGLCRACYDEKRRTSIKIGAGVPEDLAQRVRQAQASGDWKALADSLNDIVTGIAKGTIKASAAQSSLVKHILDRAYGRVSKSQEDKQGPVGIVILPSIGRDNSEDLRICPECLKHHASHI